MTILRINIDELKLLKKSYTDLEKCFASPVSWAMHVSGWEEKVIKGRSAEMLGLHQDSAKNQAILDYWYAVDAVKNLIGTTIRDVRLATDPLQVMINKLTNYLYVVQNNENNSPSSFFLGLTSSQFDARYESEFILSTVAIKGYGTFNVMRQIPGDYPITSTSKTMSFSADANIKAGINGQVTVTYTIVRMNSGLDEVIVTTTQSGGAGIEGADGVTVGANQSVTTTYLVDPSQLTSFESALKGDPLALVPGMYPAPIGQGQSVSALAIDQTVDMGVSASVSVSVPSYASNPAGLLSVTGNATATVGAGLVTDSTAQGYSPGAYVDLHLTADGSLSLLGGSLADVKGTADVDFRGQVVVGANGPEFTLSGSLMATGEISIGGKQFSPPDGYNSVMVNVTASVGYDKLPSGVLQELQSSDPSQQIKGITDALAKGVVVDYDVEYGNTSVSTEGLHAIVTNDTMTTTRTGWVEGTHGEFRI